MPRRKNWRRSEARRSVLHGSCNKPTELTVDVMQASESVMTKGLFETSPVSVQAAASPVSVQAQSPVSVQAQQRNQHSNLNLKNKDSQRSLQNKDKNKDNKADLQKKYEKKENQTNLLNKDCEMSFTERHYQINSQSADHNITLQSSGTNILPEIPTKTKSSCPTEYDNGSRSCQQYSFVASFELNTSKNICILTPVTDSILPSSCTHCFESLKPFHSQSFMCGSFHQGSDRFSVESRGSQCVSNALCALIHAQFSNTFSSTEIDQILVEGDILYKKIIASLKAAHKYTSRLLTFDEIPENVNVFRRDIHIIKSDLVSGIAVQQFDNTSSPTLHQSMHTAFQSSSYVLVMIGAICSAVYKKDGMYNFFDSHSHAQNGLSSCNGYSVLIRFSCLDDLITYMYALYDSMQIDMTTQYDLLPVALTLSENNHIGIVRSDRVVSSQKLSLGQSSSIGPSCNYLQLDFLPETISGNEVEYRVTDRSESLLENYFEDQTIKKQKKAQVQKKTYESKLKKKRTEYYATFKRKQRSMLAFKEKEKISQLASKQSARKNVDVLAKELARKKSARQNPAFKEKEKISQLLSKQSARKNVDVLAKELAKKKSTRQNPAFKEKEKISQLLSKQSARKNVDVLAKELAKKRSARQNPAFKEKEKNKSAFIKTVCQKECRCVSKRTC